MAFFTETELLRWVERNPLSVTRDDRLAHLRYAYDMARVVAMHPTASDQDFEEARVRMQVYSSEIARITNRKR